jgi:hypothetical protein
LPGKFGLRLPCLTNRESNGNLGAFLGALLAVALAVFMINGGEHLGKKTVNSDADLPPVETAK